LALLDGYGLPPAARELLIALALYKIRRFLSYGLRLRTACDLEPHGDLEVTKPEGFAVPAEAALLDAVKQGIAKCRKEKLFCDPPVTELTTNVVLKEKAPSEAEKDESLAAADTESEE
jgi:CRISPR-associated protein Csb1